MPRRQSMFAAYRGGKTYQLAQVARRAVQAGSAPSDILALTVHGSGAAVLRDTLADVVEVAVPTTTLRRRALQILQTFPDAAHLPQGWSETQLLSGIDRRVLIKRAWATVASSSSTLWERRSQQPGALDWITLMFDQWSAWCGTANAQRLPALHIQDQELAELWAAYRAYLQLCHQHRVVAFSDVFGRAIDALNHVDVRAHYQCRILLLDDIDLFQPAELLLVSALINSSTDVFASYTSQPTAESPLALERLLRQWLDEHQLASLELRSQPSHQANQIAVEYATPEDEAHAIAQRIATNIAAGAQPNEHAIIGFEAELITLLQRVLPQYGVPVEGQWARDGYTLVLASLARAGLSLLAEQPLTAAQTNTFLRHPAFGLSIVDAHYLGKAVEQGRCNPWSSDEPHWPEELSEAGRVRLQAVRDVTHRLRHVDSPPSALIREWLAQLRLNVRAWEQTAAVLEPWAVAVDQRQWKRLLDFLVQAEALQAALGMPLTLGAALDVFDSAQALIVPEGQPLHDAVRIWYPTRLGGCATRYVFIAGLHEGALPQPLQPLPYGNDSVLTTAFGALPGFAAPQITDRAAAWQRGINELHRALSRATDAAELSYSRSDRQGRRRLPSPILTAALGLQLNRHGHLQANTTRSYTPEPASHMIWPQHYVSGNILQPSAPLASVVTSSPSPLVISPSAIEDYFTCPRRCLYARVLQLDDVVSSPRQALGTVVHNALNALLNTPLLAALNETQVRNLVAQHWIGDEQRWGSRLKQTIFRQLAERAVAQQARYELEQSKNSLFLGGELSFSWTLPDTDIVLNGRIDRIDRTAEGLVVIDYKLGQHSPSINTLLSEFMPPRDNAATWRPGDIQLPVYALALEQDAVQGLTRQENERVSTVVLAYPLELYSDTGKISAKGRREIKIIDHEHGCAACEAPPAPRPKTGLMCRQQLASVVGYIQEAAAGIRAEQWEPNPREGSRTCAGCAFRPICTDPQ